MANCIEQIICNNTSDCNIAITDESGFAVDTRFLHDGDTIYLNITQRPGFTFNGFVYKPFDGHPYTIITDKVSDSRYRTTAKCGGTYIANYTTDIYDVRVVPDSSTHGSTLGSGRYTFGTVIQISAYENPGYHFVGWYINNVLISEEIEYSYTVTGDIYIVAVFEGDEYSIVAKPNNSLLGVTDGSGVYEYGTVVTLTVIPFPGSAFVSWDDGNTDAVRDVTVTGNRVYIAFFTKARYRVVVDIVNLSTSRPEETCGVVTGEGEYDYGTVVTLYASPALGFRFVSWDNGTGTVEGSTEFSFAVTGDVIIIATFDDAMYTLSLYSSPVDGGYTTNGVSPSLFTGGIYPYGTVVPAQALPYSGYVFDRWADSATNHYRTFTMVTDITQTAYFIRKTMQYTLKIFFDSSKGNVVIFNGTANVGIYGPGYVYATVDENTVLTAVVGSITPYVFTGWDDTGSPDTPRTFTMTMNIVREVRYGCDAEFFFDYQNAAVLTIGGNDYRNDTGIIAVMDGDTFTIEADNDYYLTDVIDRGTGESVGDCIYCYNSFPIPDSDGYCYYYKKINYSSIPVGSPITTIYDQRFILNSGSPHYVRLVRSGVADVYAELIVRDLNTPSVYDDIWNDLEESPFYNFVDTPTDQIPSVVGNASASSPFAIKAKGACAFFIKTKTQCTYNVRCGGEYQICLLNGIYTKPVKDWSPINAIPSSALPSEIIITPAYVNYSYFWYNNNPMTSYASGKRYAHTILHGLDFYLEIVDNC